LPIKNKLLKEKNVLQKLHPEEFKEVMNLTFRNKHFHIVAGYADFSRRQLILFSAHWFSVIVPFDKFEPSGTCSPDFNELEIIDYGNTIKLGEYEASAGVVMEHLGY